jgi:hypothetical protein
VVALGRNSARCALLTVGPAAGALAEPAGEGPALGDAPTPLLAVGEDAALGAALVAWVGCLCTVMPAGGKTLRWAVIGVAVLAVIAAAVGVRLRPELVASRSGRGGDRGPATPEH